VTEDPTGHVAVVVAHISIPTGIEAGGICTPAPGPAGHRTGLTSVPAAPHGGIRDSHRSRDRERRPGGHRARHGRLGDYADRLRRRGSSMSTPLHQLGALTRNSVGCVHLGESCHSVDQGIWARVTFGVTVGPKTRIVNTVARGHPCR
jgi:hypothetical protein